MRTGDDGWPLVPEVWLRSHHARVTACVSEVCGDGGPCAPVRRRTGIEPAQRFRFPGLPLSLGVTITNLGFWLMGRIALGR